VCAEIGSIQVLPDLKITVAGNCGDTPPPPPVPIPDSIPGPIPPPPPPPPKPIPTPLPEIIRPIPIVSPTRSGGGGGGGSRLINYDDFDETRGRNPFGDRPEELRLSDDRGYLR